MDLTRFVDEIYEAALVPELWPTVLEQLARDTEAVGAMCFTATVERSAWISSPTIAPLLEAFFRDGWMARNSRVARGMAAGIPGFISDQDMFTPAEMDADPMFAYLRERGCGWCTGTLITMPSGELLVFNIERSHARGPFEPAIMAGLEQVRPDLNRAALMAARLGFERARAGAEALAAVGLPAGVLSPGGRLMAANSLLEPLIPSVILDRAPRVQFAAAPADALLQDAIGRLAAQATPTVLSIPIPATLERPAMIAHLVPVRRNARDIFTAAACFLVVTPVNPTVVPSATILQALFDLTRAEARVAKGIAEGQAPAELARTLGLSVDTIRTQLKSVFAKVGVSRQAELVRLLGGLALE